jgi:5'-3' exonuclease
MKVVEGKFTKDEERSVADKIAEALAMMVQDENAKGNFVLIVSSDDGTTQVSTDMYAEEVNFHLDIMKHNIINNTFVRGSIH